MSNDNYSLTKSLETDNTRNALDYIICYVDNQNLSNNDNQI